MASNVADRLANAAVPAFKCPPGTKMHLLNLGTLTASSRSSWRFSIEPVAFLAPESKRRELIVLAALIEHPDGLILFETGCAEDLEIKWGAPITDLFPRTTYTEEMKLPAAIKATGHDIKDVKMIVFGHLHLDHAGGLEHFIGTDVPIYVHEEEFKHACWAVATEADLGVYLGHYMNLEKLNWVTFDEDHFDLCQGITMHLSPGHTPGLCVMQVNLDKDGTFIFTTDQYHIAENHDLSQPQGWLLRDHNGWVKSHKMINRLQKQFNATLVYGHDKEVADKLLAAKSFYE